MKSFDVEIEGVPPGLMMHRFAPEEQTKAEAEAKRAGLPAPGKEQAAELAAYRLEDGELYLPAEHLVQSMKRASSEFKIKGRGKKTYKDAVSAYVNVSPEFMGLGVSEYVIDSRPVRIQRSRVIRHRPWFANWKLSVVLELTLEDIVPDEVLNKILVTAGQMYAVGDYRPRFGRFIVTRFQKSNSS